jgi:hypothetical protein
MSGDDWKECENHEVFWGSSRQAVSTALRSPPVKAADQPTPWPTAGWQTALIGVAIQQGYIESVDQPVLDFFPNMAIANVDAKIVKWPSQGSLTTTTARPRRLKSSHDWFF